MAVIDILFPRARVEILRLLFTTSDKSLHVRDIVRLSGLGIGTIQAEVRKLTAAELLTQRRDGNRLYYSPNTSHPIYPELCSIATKTLGLHAQLHQALHDVAGIEAVVVFGSWASESLGADSDIDLLIIGTIGLRKLVPRLRPISQALSREINPYLLTATELNEKLINQDTFILNVKNSKKQTILGKLDELK